MGGASATSFAAMSGVRAGQSHMSNYSQVQVESAKDSSRSYDDETSPLCSESARTRTRADSWEETDAVPTCKRYDHSTRY